MIAIQVGWGAMAESSVFEQQLLAGDPEAGAWSEVAMLEASEPGADNNFGIHVAISGGTAVIGDQHGGLTGMDDAGTAHVVDVLQVFSDGFEGGDTTAWN
jgi:hypothetical protein